MWAECLFADPIADIAVLGMPDDQALPDEANSYKRLLGSRQPLLITDAPAREQSCKARLFSLDGEWFECSINRWNAWLSVEPAEDVKPGSQAHQLFRWMVGRLVCSLPLTKTQFLWMICRDAY